MPELDLVCVCFSLYEPSLAVKDAEARENVATNVSVGNSVCNELDCEFEGCVGVEERVADSSTVRLTVVDGVMGSSSVWTLV